ncbi:hypothetical protein OG552_10810 [Streptomyces sp. NBC_01476]|uniref:hypothetical protein n=1 Tax=Streptomyces sp. NBC_01476 TaxID=2903881 RepID=UPI002E35C18D|nr:hypothetical protein [Streptomyces sp. NBC_01476]
MPPPPCTCAVARPRPVAATRSPEAVNAEIHELADRAPLTDADQVRLAELYAEWLAVARERDAA